MVGIQTGVWDEETSGFDSSLSSIGFYKIQPGSAVSGGFSSFDEVDYYLLGAGLNFFHLTVSSRPNYVVTSEILDADGVHHKNFEVRVKDQNGYVTAQTSHVINDYTVQHVYDVTGLDSPYLEITNSYLRTFNYYVNITDIGTPQVSTLPLLSISTSNNKLDEGSSEDKEIVFIASLSKSSNDVVSVNYRVYGSEKNASEDLRNTTGTLVFDPGEISKSFSIFSIGDNVYETDEAFRVTLENPVNALLDLSGESIKAYESLLILQNDDVLNLPIVSISPANGKIIEGDSGKQSVIFTVSLSNSYSDVVSVDYRTYEVSAIAGEDFEAVNGTLIFNPGETSKSFVVPVFGDTIHEYDEVFRVTLESPINAILDLSGTIIKGHEAQVIIQTDESNFPTVTISPLIGEIREGNIGRWDRDNAFSFTASLSNASEDYVFVEYKIYSFTENPEDDIEVYRWRAGDPNTPQTRGFIQFNPGEISKSFSVSIIGDKVYETDETFRIVLENPINAVINLSDSSAKDYEAVLTILNDDGPKVSISSDTYFLGVNQTALITFVLSEASSDFTLEDIDVSGGTLSGFTGSGTLYTAIFAPPNDSSAPGVIRVSSNKFSNSEGDFFNVDGFDPNNRISLAVKTTNTGQKLSLSEKEVAGNLEYYADGTGGTPGSFIRVKDINKDGIDEVFFAAAESAPNTPENYDNTSVLIFGWKNGVFQNITNDWLPNGTNQVQGVGDIAFGDFDGNGTIDVYLSAYTDMTFAVRRYALMNNGTSFKVVDLGDGLWDHAAVSADINKDGYDDVIQTGYNARSNFMGSPHGLIKYDQGLGGSGLVIGDFLGDGTTSIIYTDQGLDVLGNLYTIRFENESITHNFVASLPAPRIELNSHDIRAESIDFNHDGLLDVVVFSWEFPPPSWDFISSEIQFLQNLGEGNFIDVTDQVRVGFDTSGGVSYTPQFVDVNNDGLIDIFTSRGDYFDEHRSTTLLQQQRDGTFVATDTDLFRADVGGAKSALARGPNGSFYLVTEEAWQWSEVLTEVSIRELIANSIPTGAVSISGTARQGQVLTASNTLADVDGLGTVTYQWRSDGNNISGARSSTYTLTQAEVGKAITVVASYTDLLGSAESVSSSASRSVEAVLSATYTAPVSSIDSIGLSPDGQYLLIKVDGVTQSVPVGSSLSFNGTTVTTSDLTSSITPQPVFQSSGGSNGYALPEVFTGHPSLNLDYQLIETADNAVVIGGATNDFIKVASTNSLGKAVDAGAGDDVIDGGVGSTFITGGAGSDTIFLDGRAAGVSWSTVTDFTFGQDKATIWGWKAGVSKVSTIFTDFNTGGAPGYTGLTLHFENLLPDDAAPGQTNSNFNSITLTGLTLADFGATSLETLNAQITAGTNSHFITGQTTDEYGVHGYLFLS